MEDELAIDGYCRLAGRPELMMPAFVLLEIERSRALKVLEVLRPETSDNRLP